MKKFIGIVLVLCSLALPLAGCKEAISTVTSTTMSELEDIPSQMLATPESADTEPEYNYQTKAGKAHGFSRGMIGRTLELLWEKFQNNFVYIHVFVTTWHLKYDIIDI